MKLSAHAVEYSWDDLVVSVIPYLLSSFHLTVSRLVSRKIVHQLLCEWYFLTLFLGWFRVLPVIEGLRKKTEEALDVNPFILSMTLYATVKICIAGCMQHIPICTSNNFSLRLVEKKSNNMRVRTDIKQDIRAHPIRHVPLFVLLFSSCPYFNLPRRS